MSDYGICMSKCSACELFMPHKVWPVYEENGKDYQIIKCVKCKRKIKVETGNNGEDFQDNLDNDSFEIL